ncbi:VCBS domain-containing protein, partial [Vogesella facilis]
MATTSSGGTTTSFSNTPQASDDTFSSALINGLSSTITEDLLAVMYLDVMANDLGGNAKTLWSLDDGISTSTGTKTYAPADLLVQDDKGGVIDSTPDYSANGAKIWITADGKVGYDATMLSDTFKASLQALSAGEVLKDSFTYAIRLGNGTLSWATAQVAFSGANDVITLSTASISSGTVTEDAQQTPSPSDKLTTSGSIAFHDADAHDLHSASFAPAAGNSTALGTFTLAPLTEGSGTTDGSVNWTYALNNAAAQYLAEGQTVTETYVVTINDGHGAVLTQNVTVTIVGTNDAPQIDATHTTASGTVSEGDDSSSMSTSGVIAYSDVDSSDSHSFALHGTPAAYGTASVDTDGSWHYTVHDSGAVDALAAGETLADSFTVRVSDNHGGYVDQLVTITITGTNDAPTVATDSDAATNIVAEGAANGTLVGITAHATDVDHGSVVTYTLSDDAGGRFQIDPVTGVVSVANGALLDYETATSHSITVLAADGVGGSSSQSFTINIGNVNDNPVVGPSDSDAANNAVDENSSVGTTVGLTAFASDADAGGQAIAYTLSDNAGGRFAIDASTGLVTVAGALDREAADHYDITVRATSADGSTADKTF